MNSVSKCAAFLENSENCFQEYERLLDAFYRTDLKHLKFIHSDDKGKIIISTAKCNINGTELADMLRSDYSIECEMASLHYIILMTSVADKASAFSALAAALKEIDSKLSPCKKDVLSKPAVPQEIELACSAGKISAEYVYAYPPDIPLIVPGETISSEFQTVIQKMLKSGIHIISDSELLPSYILTKAD